MLRPMFQRSITIHALSFQDSVLGNDTVTPTKEIREFSMLVLQILWNETYTSMW
jgi:hypothetical protein